MIFRKGENKRHILNILAEGVLQSTERVKNCALLWGNFLIELPEHEASLRSAFLQISSEPFTEQLPFFRFQPFRLDLPSEAPLLPYLISALLNNRRGHLHEIEDDKALEIINRNVSEMIDNPLSLQEVFDDSSQVRCIRSAAIIAYLLHSSGTKELRSLKQLLVELYVPKVDSWYIQAVVTCLCLLTTEEDSQAQEIVNSLLDAARADYEARQHLNRILALWRESSYAPVQKAGIQEKWLTGSG